MLERVIPFVSHAVQYGGKKEQLVASFIRFLERKLGVRVVYFEDDFGFGRADLAVPLATAQKLRSAGILSTLHAVSLRPDEPLFKFWRGSVRNDRQHVVGGASAESDTQAILATLAEALERYLWTEATDYFKDPVDATATEIEKHGHSIAPQRFVGFSEEQREGTPDLRLEESARYRWIRGTSLISGVPLYLPAQIVSGSRSVRPLTGTRESFIRLPITNGLATAETRMGAQLHGALELIERDAFIIMWLNQLTYPRIALDQLDNPSTSLQQLLIRCKKYRYEVHAVSMATDAPTYAICVILEDKTNAMPRFSFGLKAHSNLSRAIEGALCEALRARTNVRNNLAEGTSWDHARPVEEVGHRDRMYYWAHPEYSKRLEFLVAGQLLPATSARWDNDTIPEHLNRITEWCKNLGYEFVSVPLTHSAHNPTDWHIEMVVMPELQPMHLLEKMRYLGGNRLKSVPRACGYTPASSFPQEPHPFC